MKPTIKGPPGGPLPTCPSCGAKLEYLKVVQLNSPFSCPNCRAELCVPRLYGLLGFWLSLANSVLLSIAIGLRGLYLLLGVLRSTVNVPSGNCGHRLFTSAFVSA